MNERSRKIYNNWTVLGPDGMFMFYTGDKKAKWYLDSSLAHVIWGKVIQLDFQPNGPGCQDRYRSTPAVNECVVCGTTVRLTLHHVVPTQYRKILCYHFPYYCRDHHDCLPLCVSCHKKYENKANLLSGKIASKFGVPLQGMINAPFSIAGLLQHSRVASSVLKWGHRMSEDIKKELTVRALAFSDMSIVNLSIARKEDFEYRTHGDLVVENIMTNHEEDNFVRLWRQHFVDSMTPKCLPEYWEINRPVFRDRQHLEDYR